MLFLHLLVLNSRRWTVFREENGSAAECSQININDSLWLQTQWKVESYVFGHLLRVANSEKKIIFLKVFLATVKS